MGWTTERTTGENLITRTSLGIINTMHHREGILVFTISYSNFLFNWGWVDIVASLVSNFCRFGNRQFHHRQNAQGNFKFNNQNRGKGGGVLNFSMFLYQFTKFKFTIINQENVWLLFIYWFTMHMVLGILFPFFELFIFVNFYWQCKANFWDEPLREAFDSSIWPSCFNPPQHGFTNG